MKNSFPFDVRLSLFLFFLFLIMVTPGVAQELDPDWVPELDDYPEIANNWPLCGDTTNTGTPWPVGNPCLSTLPDRIVSTYGPRGAPFGFHRGIDLRTLEMELDNGQACVSCIPDHRPVFAVAAGEIDEVKLKCVGGVPDGYRVQIKHGSPEGRWYSLYVHLSSLEPLLASPPLGCPPSASSTFDLSYTLEGTAVGPGQHIGNTGKSASNNHHLHFEVRKDDDDARHAVHPFRKLPTVAALGTIEVSSHGLEIDQPRIELTSQRFDVVRAELQVAGCNEPAPGECLICDPYINVPFGAAQNGYVVAPTHFDYELLNYQYTHQGRTLWTSTGGFPDCPFSADHENDYESGIHLDDSSFNSISVGISGGLDPHYFRSFRFDDAAIPFYPSYEYTCVRAVVHLADGAVLESAELACRSTAGGSVIYKN